MYYPTASEREKNREEEMRIHTNRQYGERPMAGAVELNELCDEGATQPGIYIKCKYCTTYSPDI